MKPDLEKLRQLAQAATKGPWRWTLTKQSVRDEVLEYFAAHYDKCQEGPLHGVGIPAPGRAIEEECLAVSITGNGPTSEANAQYIAALDPQIVLGLIDEIEKQAKYHAATANVCADKIELLRAENESLQKVLKEAQLKAWNAGVRAATKSIEDSHKYGFSDVTDGLLNNMNLGKEE